MQYPWWREQIPTSNWLLAELKSSSHGGRLIITIHRPESRRLILQLLNSCNS